MILNRHECAVHSLAGNRKRAGCGNKQCIPTFAMKTTIGGSFGNYYFPTPFEVTACSTRSLPLSGTIASVFSFIRLSLLAFSSGPQNTKIVLLADLSLAKTFFFFSLSHYAFLDFSIFLLAGVICSSWESGPKLRDRHRDDGQHGSHNQQEIA